MNAMWDGRNTPRKRKNSAKSGKVGMSVQLFSIKHSSKSTPGNCCGSTYPTSEKNLINRNPFHVGGKKFGEL